MPVISVRIPQLGEGLHEALLVEFLKQPGDRIARDEPIYVMETDKATTDVESPYAGTLVEWTVDSGTVLEIGTEIAKMEVAEGVKEMSTGHAGLSRDITASASPNVAAGRSPQQDSPTSPSSSARSSIIIPPKTRKYLKDHNLLDEADKIPCSGTKLMPADVDAYLASIGSGSVSSELYETQPLPKSQIVLNYRLARGTAACIPVTVMNEIDWTAINVARQIAKAQRGPTGFAMACWVVVQSMKDFPKFRSSLTADGNSLRVFKHVNLGVAVALPGDEMLTAVVRRADKMSANDFFVAFEKQVLAARDGQDQADESTTLTVSNIGKSGMRIGIPAIVAPAVATLAIGEVYSHPVPDGKSFKFLSRVMATLSFDHRIANGVGAANFLNDVRNKIETFEFTNS